uniref:Very-long-chain (3R)-3-hydroxyacyl-CoA dehydratase n=1 Tax=Ascaris lumbricoides TaxID=6252 RepID=A0A0M3ICZ3_ASCLU
MTSYPFVYWAQDEESVFLTVDLKDASNTKYTISGNVFDFRSIGTGAQGRKDYSFQLALFDDVSMHKVSDGCGRRLVYSLKKKNKGWWPTITKQPGRISWLRVDFDRFKDPDESDDDFEVVSPQMMAEKEMDSLTQRLLMDTTRRPKPFSDRLSALKKIREEFGDLLGHYLFTCNATLFLIHFYVLAVLLFKFSTYGNEYVERFWEEKSTAVMMATALQLLDVAHAALGLTKSGYHIALLQVVGRLAMLFIIDGDPELHRAMSTYFLIVVYFLIEMFRYPYYALSCLKMQYSIVTFLRYTAWIPLYPTGLIFEAITMSRAVPYYYTSGVYGVQMPNVANIDFNFGIFLAVFLLFVFPFIGYHLISHMRHQSRKKLEELRKKRE